MQESIPVLQDYSTYDVHSAVFKISDRCNLGCKYCYRENSDALIKRFDMGVDVIDRALSTLFDFKMDLYNRIGYNDAPSLNFIFHGGEPMIVGVERFKEILDVQSKYVSRGFILRNNVQTNGTLITDDFAQLFKEEGFRVGISIDGPREIHDLFRTYRNGRSSFDDTVDGINVLRDHGVPWSAISVINRDYLGHEKRMFEFFKENGTMEVDFTPSFFYDSPLTLPPEMYAAFMNRMFDIWMEADAPFEIRFFKDVMYILGYRRIPNKSTIICELSGKCHRNISIGSKGDIYSCECLNSLHSNLIGNIMVESYKDIVNGQRFKTMSNSTNRYCLDCLNCDIFPICKAGCYNRRLPGPDGAPRLDYYCQARKDIIHHIQDVCNHMLDE